jgi:glycosyltransferase involved in cell wall biosynthesis
MHPLAGLPSRQDLYIGLQRQTEWELLIVTPRRWKDDYGRIVEASASPDLRGQLLALPIGRSGNYPLHYFRSRLKKYIREFEPDCIYLCHEPYAVSTFQMLRAAKAVTSVPVGVRSSQNIAKRYPSPFRQAERFVYRNSDFAIVVTENVANVMRTKGYTKPISVIPMPVDLRTFSPPPARSHGSQMRIGFVGRLVPEKGVDTALMAVSRLPRGSVNLTIIGDGSYGPELQKLANSLGLDDAVTWLGALDRVSTAAAFQDFDIVLVPSKETKRWREQFGRVVVEAAATAVPVIATRSGELPFLVAAANAGWIVEEGNAIEMAEVLRVLLDDRTQLRQVGQRARDAVIERYSEQVVIDQLAHTLSEAVASRAEPC